MKKIILAFFVIAAVALAPGGMMVCAAAPSLSMEAQLKTVHILNFTRFVNWPADTFADTNSPITIGVLGDAAFAAALGETVKGEVVKGHSLVVVPATNVGEIKNCHVVFVSNSAKAQHSQILDALAGSHTLIVGETDGFAERGGVFNFYLKDNRIRIELNLSEARKRELKVSSQLIKLCKIVGVTDDETAEAKP